MNADQAGQANYEDLKKDICEIKEILKPIAETYQTAINIGRVAKWGVGFLLLILSSLVAWKNLINK